MRNSVIITLIVLTSFLLSCREQVLPSSKLAVGEFIIGQSFSECYNRAKAQEPSLTHLMQEENDSLFSCVMYTSVVGKTIVRNIRAYGWEDTIGYITYSVDNENWWREDQKVLDYYQEQFGKRKPKRVSSTKKDKRKYIGYEYLWRFQNGVIRIVKHTHYIIPFDNQVSYDGITVDFFRTNI